MSVSSLINLLIIFFTNRLVCNSIKKSCQTASFFLNSSVVCKPPYNGERKKSKAIVLNVKVVGD